jgi:hypothetical protein
MISVRQIVFASACFAVNMTIQKVTVINSCSEDVYFGASVPSNQKIAAGQTWSGDWKLGNGNTPGRFGFSYFADSLAGGKPGNDNPRDFASIEVAAGVLLPNTPTAVGGWNFINQPGYIDMDLEVTAFSGDDLACDDAKVRVALDISKCSEMGDGSGSLENIRGRQWCKSAFSNPNGCSTSAAGMTACTSAYASYVSDNSLLWKPQGSSATAGHWLAQPRSTGQKAPGDKPQCPAQFADGFVAMPTLNGRVACGENQNGPNAVNFECYESCCKPEAMGTKFRPVNAARVAACEKVNGASSGNAGFMQCAGKGAVTITNLQIETCPPRGRLGSEEKVAMPSCARRRLRSSKPKQLSDAPQCGPAVHKDGAPQNPEQWSPEAPKVSSSSSNSANGVTSSTTASATSSSADSTTQSSASSKTSSASSTTTASPAESESDEPSSNSGTTVSPTDSGSDSSSTSSTTVAPVDSTTSFQV